jgi:RimJ/RimL family protein N-acetyltransferase
MFPRDVIPAGPFVLRLPSQADAEAISRGCADPDIVRYIPTVPVPYTREDALAYVGKLARETWDHGGASFAIADALSDEWLGNIAIKPLNLRGAGEIGYLVAPWARGRGAASAATRAVTEWAFSHGLSRAELLTDVENVASQRVAMAAGFLREGVLRAAETRRDGSRGDLVMFARLDGDPGHPVRAFLPAFPGGALSDGVVRLAPMTAGDAGDYHALVSLPDVLKHSVSVTPPAFEDSLRRCRYAGTWWLGGERAEIVVRDAATGAFAGHIQLMHVLPALAQAQVGYSLRPEYRGRGLATRALRLLADWALTATPLARLAAGTSPENTASHRVLEKAGFTREGVIRGQRPGLDGARLDDLQWARLRPRTT